jgi:hypothetical protein
LFLSNEKNSILGISLRAEGPYFVNIPVKSWAVPPTSPRNDSPRRTASARLEGLTVSRIERLPPDYWFFKFGNGIVLSTQSQWRLLSPKAILLTSEDDGQQYGLPEPVDAIARIRELLESRGVSKVEVDKASLTSISASTMTRCSRS